MIDTPFIPWENSNIFYAFVQNRIEKILYNFFPCAVSE